MIYLLPLLSYLAGYKKRFRPSARPTLIRWQVPLEKLSLRRAAMSKYSASFCQLWYENERFNVFLRFGALCLQSLSLPVRRLQSEWIATKRFGINWVSIDATWKPPYSLHIGRGLFRQTAVFRCSTSSVVHPSQSERLVYLENGWTDLDSPNFRGIFVLDWPTTTPDTVAPTTSGRKLWRKKRLSKMTTPPMYSVWISLERFKRG